MARRRGTPACIDPIISHRFALDDYEAAFETLLAGDAGKVILDIA